MFLYVYFFINIFLSLLRTSISIHIYTSTSHTSSSIDRFYCSVSTQIPITMITHIHWSLHVTISDILSIFIRIHILSIYPTTELVLALLHHCQRLHSLLFLNGDGLSLSSHGLIPVCVFNSLTLNHMLSIPHILSLLNDSLQHLYPYKCTLALELSKISSLLVCTQY